MKATPRKRRTARITLTCTEDEKAAILRFAQHVGINRNVANAAHCILRNQLIASPTELTIHSFPPEQSLELWVWANQQAQERGEPRPTKEETLLRSNCGTRVIRPALEVADGASIPENLILFPQPQEAVRAN